MRKMGLNTQAKFLGKAKLTRQGQVTLPNEGRRDLSIEVNSEVYWYELGDNLIVVKELVNPRDLKVGLKGGAKK
jgi:bifunctional DNA-binding transcriptional regulator/antitoxin component of YhaV-PrlF toxin-antitoxin module